MALNIENTSGAPLAINDLGIELAIGQIVDLSQIESPDVIANSANGGDLEAVITAPSVSVKDPLDGTTSLSVADGLVAARAMNETHWRVGAGARIGDISDVDLSGAVAGEVLQLGGSGNWENVSGSSVLAGVFSDDDGDTAVKVEESADEDIIRFDVGDTPAGYGAVTDIMTISSSGWTVGMGTADAATAGAPIGFTAGTGGTTGAGGNITLDGGPGGATSGDGGDILLRSGNAQGSSGEGGRLIARAGDGVGADAGGVARLIGGNAGPTGVGGNSEVTAGDGGATSGGGGDVLITAGGVSTATDDGGDVVITAGDGGSTSGTGGNITLAAGDGDTDGVVRIPNKAGTNALIIDYDTDATNAVEFRQESGSGTTIWNSNSVIGQWIFGSDAAGTTDLFIDCDNNGTMHLNGLHSGPVRIGEGGLQLEESGGGAMMISILAGNTMTSDYTITLPEDQGAANTVLVNDGAGNLSWTNVADSDNATFLLEWRFSTNTTAADPGNGRFRYNNATLASVTEIYFDDLSNGGVDVSNILNSLRTGDKIYIQETDLATSAVLFTVVSVTDNIGWFTVVVTVDDSGVLHGNNRKCSAALLIGVSNRDKWGSITPDAGDTLVPDSDSDTLTIAGGTNVTTTGTGASDTLTIDGVNIWNTIAGDSGSTTPDTALDTLTIAGGTDVSTSVSGDTLTIDFTGTTASPGGSDSHVQYNNGGVFGGEANFTYDDTLKRVAVDGIDETTQMTIGGTTDLANANNAALYIEVNDPSGLMHTGMHTYFNRASPGINGYIAYEYDGNTPNIAVVDEDDDPPYIHFAVIGSGTRAAPEFESRFGMRGPVAGATTGFSWYVDGTETLTHDTNFLNIIDSGATYQIAGVPITVGTQVIQKFVFSACALDSPVNSNWTVNSLAPAVADSANAALTVRRFDDTTEEGVGFMLNIPSGATNMTIRFKSRAQTAPGGAVTVLPRLYRRTIPDNAAVTAWSSAFAMTALSIPTNTNFQYDEQTITLATLGLTAGNTAQFELTRNPADTLTGDWVLLQVEVEFS